MGNRSSARAEVNSFVESAIKIYSNTVQDCINREENINTFRIKAKGDVNVSDVNIKQIAVLKSNCLQSATNNAKAEQEIKELIKNSSEAITGALNLFSKADSETITNMTKKLATEIQNTVQQKCMNDVLNENVFDLESTQGRGVMKGINIEQYAESALECAQSALANSEAKTALDQTIDNKSKATVKGLEDAMLWLLILLGCALLAFFLLQNFAGSALGNGNIFLIVLIGICAYCVAVYQSNGTPYWLLPEKSRKPIFFSLLGLMIVLTLVLFYRLVKK